MPRTSKKSDGLSGAASIEMRTSSGPRFKQVHRASQEANRPHSGVLLRYALLDPCHLSWRIGIPPSKSTF